MEIKTINEIASMGGKAYWSKIKKEKTPEQISKEMSKRGKKGGRPKIKK